MNKVRKIFSNSKHKYLICSLLITCIALGALFSNKHIVVPVNGSNINVCFTPPKGCRNQIIKIIDEAKEEIYMQAYSFTSIEIAEALIKAVNRGITVKLLIDKTSLTAKSSKINLLTKNGIMVEVCNVPGIAHNKVLIIDKKLVITGSYNFTQAAETRNAENIIFIYNQAIAETFLKNWFKLQSR